MRDDVLSDLLRAVHLTGSMFIRLQVRAPYSLLALDVERLSERYAPGARYILPFHLVTRGPMWCDVIDTGSTHCLYDGDVIVLPHGHAHSVSDCPGSRPTLPEEVEHAITGNPPTLSWGGQGEPAGMLCGFFYCNSRLFNPLISALPDVLVVRHDPERSSWLAATLQRAFDEAALSRAGGPAMIGRLTELLFLEVVQRYLEEGEPSGWLGALNDPLVAGALACLHAEPDRDWTLKSLAQEVSASRSALSEHFTQAIGLPPIRYLATWRMELAAQRLAETTDSVAAIAAAVGYDSEAAFNRAFKRHSGDPPATWRRRQFQQVLAHEPE